MWKMFNVVMRIINSLLGVAMIAMGCIWILQARNLAFNGPMMNGQRSFMVGDNHWLMYGIILALFGLAQAIWSNRRQS